MFPFEHNSSFQFCHHFVVVFPNSNPAFFLKLSKCIFKHFFSCLSHLLFFKQLKKLFFINSASQYHFVFNYLQQCLHSSFIYKVFILHLLVCYHIIIYLLFFVVIFFLIWNYSYFLFFYLISVFFLRIH